MSESSIAETGVADPVGTGSRWHLFWNGGGFWKAVLVAVGYLALYQGLSRLLGLAVGDLVDKDNPFADPLSALLTIGAGPIMGSILLVIFARSLGWLPRPLFGRQPVQGSWWMWAAPVLVLVPIVTHALGTDYSRYSAGVILAVLVAGLFVGFSEEMVTRGIGIVLLRRGGYREQAVMLLSSIIFGLMHLANLISGQAIETVIPIVLYAVGFGICMYLTLRITGSLVWPILLHAFTDPTTILASGGIDQQVANTDNTWLLVATVSTVAYVLLALVATFVVRGHAHGRSDADEPARVPAHDTSGA